MRPILLAGALMSAAPALAHHSFAMFDPAKRMTIDGTIETLQWTAPHVILWVRAGKVGPYDAGLWSVELPTSPGNLGKMGWSRTTVAPGDKIRVDIDPIRDGRRSGSFKRAVLVRTGKVLTVGPVPGGTNDPAAK
ncbi:DUF6152 family protein [Sphingomonas sp. MMS24-J13]|uniref:DUF6152 family protein n=1 Tax=Sphingomonas sp. MMS24-J13 TaxID=3238686 RepID=UPI0038510EA1